MPTPTYTDKTLSNLVISKISQAKFDELKNAGLLNEDELYLVENETLDAMGNVVKNVGTPVQNTDAANKAYVDGKTLPVATSSTAGIVKPDGTTITVDANGVISSSGGGGGGGGGATGYTVTFANDYSEHYANYQVVTAPIRFIKADGTSEVIDLVNASSLRGQTVQNIVMLASELWEGEECFRPIGFGDGDEYLRFRDGDSNNCRGLWMMMNGLKTGMLTIANCNAYASQVFPWNVGEDSEFTHLHLTGDATITHINAGIPCLLKGTLVRLANGQDKPIEEITYDDELLVWDFDNGKFSSAKPLWIKKVQKANYYFKNILASGKELLTTGQSKTGWGHRMFDMNKGKFRYTTETVSDRIFTLDGTDLHKSCERIEAECEHYNIITEKHFNLFANGILTSCSLNNLYPVKDMKFVKDNRRLRPYEAYDVPAELYKGLRLDEQTGDVTELNEYIKNLANTATERNKI